MIQLDYKSGVPIYDQLINGIIRLKVLGVLKPNDSLPSVRQLATKLSINPNTVQRAYKSLEEKGVIYSVTGKGSFISDDNSAADNIKQLALAQFKKAVKEAKEKGITNSELLEIIEKLEEGKLCLKL